MYKLKYLGMQTASTNLCERMGRSQELRIPAWYRDRMPPVQQVQWYYNGVEMIGNDT